MVPISISKSKKKEPNFHQYFRTVKPLNFQHLQYLILNEIWSPCVWQEGRRHMNNYVFCQLAALDFDEGKPSLEAMVDWLEVRGHPHILMTTKSHQKEKVKPSGKIDAPCDRYRLILPLDKPLNKEPKRFQWQMKQFRKTWPHVDKSCCDAARFYWPCKDLVSASAKGDLFCVKNAPTLRVLEEREKSLGEKDRVIGAAGGVPECIRVFFTSGIYKGERRPTYFKYAARLRRCGWEYSKIEQSLLSAPVDRSDLDINDLRRQITNGFKAGGTR